MATHEKILVLRIRTLERLITRMAAEMAKDKLQLPLPEVQMIVALSNLGPTKVMDASRYAEQDKSQASRVIESLITRGLAQRKPDKNDARGPTVSLTTKGRAVVRKIQPVEALLQASVFHSLSATEVKQLGKIVDKILNSYKWPTEDA